MTPLADEILGEHAHELAEAGRAEWLRLEALRHPSAARMAFDLIDPEA